MTCVWSLAQPLRCFGGPLDGQQLTMPTDQRDMVLYEENPSASVEDIEPSPSHDAAWGVRQETKLYLPAQFGSHDLKAHDVLTHPERCCLSGWVLVEEDLHAELCADPHRHPIVLEFRFVMSLPRRMWGSR